MNLSKPTKKLNEVVKQFGKAFDTYDFICINTIDECNIDAYFVNLYMRDWIVLHVDKTLYNKHGKIRFEGAVKYIYEIVKNVPEDVINFMNANRTISYEEFDKYLKFNLYEFSGNTCLLTPENGFRLVDYKDNKRGLYYHLWLQLSKVDSFILNVFPQRKEIEIDLFDEYFGMGLCYLSMQEINKINNKLEELEKLGILNKKQ